MASMGSVAGRLSSQRLLELVHDWRFWAHLLAAAVIPIVTYIVRVGTLASYLVSPGGEIAYSLLGLLLICTALTGRVAIREIRRMKAAMSLGAPRGQVRYGPRIVATFFLMSALACVTAIAIRAAVGPYASSRKEWAGLLNQTCAKEVPGFPIHFR